MTNAYYIKLIIRSFTDDLTKHESAQLAKWRQAQPDNENLFSELEETWRSIHPKRMPAPLNTETAWKALEAQLETSTGQFSNAIYTPEGFSWIWKAAAIFFLTTGSLLLLKQGGSKKNDSKLQNMPSENLVFHVDS